MTSRIETTTSELESKGWSLKEETTYGLQMKDYTILIFEKGDKIKLVNGSGGFGGRAIEGYKSSHGIRNYC